MIVFISYCRKDAALVHLLEYVLRKSGIKCLFDRKLEAGQEFTPEIQNMISKSDVFVVPWTNEASASNWVNQEIGFALGKNIPIIPIGIEKDNLPLGMLRFIQSYPLFDWDNMDGLIKTIKSAAQTPKILNINDNPDFDLAISGREKRTQFIIDGLNELQKEKENITIYVQAAFSIFAISDSDAYRTITGHPKSYMDLLLKEKAAFETLLKRKNVELRMILWPVRLYAGQLLEMRYKNLLNWMEDILAHPPIAHISFVCSEYEGLNRVVLSGIADKELLLEGIKQRGAPGYEVNILSRKPINIKNAISKFDSVFEDACSRGLVGPGAIEEVKRLRNEQLARA